MRNSSHKWLQWVSLFASKVKKPNAGSKYNTPIKINFPGGDSSLANGIAIYRLQVPSSEGAYGDNTDTITVVCGRDSELSDESYLSNLDTDDLNEVEKVRHKPVFQKVAAGLALRRIALTVASEGKVNAEDWKFGRTGNGKPYICEGLPQYSFSITHCDGASFAAVSTRHRVGIDAEMVSGIIEESLIQDTLSCNEQKAMEKLPEAEKTSRFFELWTLKEAYTKLTGTGLAVDLKQVAFELKPQRIEVIGQDIKTRFLTWKTINGSHPCQIALAFI